MKIAISVIVPVFNMEQYIRQCLDSLINQTLKAVEIIIINDGSTDGSLDIIKEYINKNDQILLIDKENEGVGAARNDGIKLATGEYISFVDPDDYLASPTIFEECYNTAIEFNVPIVGGKRQFLTSNDQIIQATDCIENVNLNLKSGINNYKDYQYDYGFQSYIYKRSIISDSNISFPLYTRFQDPPFFVKTMNIAEKFYFIDKPFYNYRVGNGTLKFSAVKTRDLIQGIVDNLDYSRNNELPTLHFITAQRLCREASFFVGNNLTSDDRINLFSNLIRAVSHIDLDWLDDNGYNINLVILPNIIFELIDTQLKYVKLRKNPLINIFSKIYKMF